MTGHDLVAIEIEPELDTDGTDRRPIVDTEARRRPQIGDAQVARLREDVARIDERDARKSLRDVDAQLRVDDHFAVAARWKTRRADRRRRAEPIEREATYGRVAA